MMTKNLPRGKRRHGRVASVLIVAGGCGLVVVALSAPVARAQLILSAVAVIAVWFSPPDKSGRSLTKPASCSRCARKPSRPCALPIRRDRSQRRGRRRRRRVVYPDEAECAPRVLFLDGRH